MTEEFFIELQNQVSKAKQELEKIELQINLIDRINQKETKESKLYFQIKNELEQLIKLLEF